MSSGKGVRLYIIQQHKRLINTKGKKEVNKHKLLHA